MQTTNTTFPVAEIHLSYKNKPNLSQRPIISKSYDAYEVFLDSWDGDKIGFIEQAKVLLLNRANRVLGICEMGTGGVSGVVVDPKLVFIAALKANASSIILAHNHPSQNTKPSLADKKITAQIKEVGKIMEIEMLDHLIVTPISYYSFAEDATYENETIMKNRFIDPFKAPYNEKKEMTLLPQTLTHESASCNLPTMPLTKTETAYDLLIHSWEANRLDVVQNFRLLLLDEECRATHAISLPLESNCASIADAQKLITIAAKENAQHIILAQNKPYGIILPHNTDLDFTQTLAREGNEHDITLLDYLFINQNGYYSYYDNEFCVRDRLQPS